MDGADTADVPQAATDDASLVERLGAAVVIVEESSANLKITTPADLQMAEGMLAGGAIWDDSHG